MKILLYSDLHQYSKERVDSFFNYAPPSDTYDIIVLAGDITNGDVDLFEYICNKFDKPIYAVLGNHDYYKSKISTIVNRYKKINVNLLTGDNEFKLNFEGKEYTIIGGTGWSSFNLYDEHPKDYYKRIAKECVNDFSLITNKDNILVTPDDYETFHNTEWNHYIKYKNKPNTILITHFPLSKICLDPFYSSPLYKNLNPYFINDKDTSGFSLILSGHTHTCIDGVDEYGCRHVINAYGYQSEFERNLSKVIEGSNNFISNKIIEV